MSLYYTVTFIIKAKCNYENLEIILSRGKELGYSYFKEIRDIDTDVEIPLDDAINKILNLSQDEDFNDLGVKINKETYTHLMLLKKDDNNFFLWFTRLFKPNDEDNVKLYLAQYAEVLLYMTQAFVVENIVIEDEYPLEEFDQQNKFYSVINFEINIDAILNILNNGSKLGIKFNKSNKDLAQEISNNLKDNRSFKLNFEYDGESGDIKFEKYFPDYNTWSEEDFNMMAALFEYRKKINSVPDKESLVFLRLTDLKQSWIKRFSDGTQALDLAKYAHLILSLIQGFEMKELKVGKSLSSPQNVN